jgi:hypothetical protein
MSAPDLPTNEYTWLGVDDVKAKAKQIPEQSLKEWLATLPQFYQHQSTIFTDLGKSKGHSKTGCQIC